jgi:hypothetical protein
MGKVVLLFVLTTCYAPEELPERILKMKEAD